MKQALELGLNILYKLIYVIKLLIFFFFLKSCHSGEFKASKILLAMQIDKNIAANAIRLSVGRDTTRAQVDLAVKDIRQSIDKILSN